MEVKRSRRFDLQYPGGIRDLLHLPSQHCCRPFKNNTGPIKQRIFPWPNECLGICTLRMKQLTTHFFDEPRLHTTWHLMVDNMAVNSALMYYNIIYRLVSYQQICKVVTIARSTKKDLDGADVGELNMWAPIDDWFRSYALHGAT